jgi:MFS family permease
MALASAAVNSMGAFVPAWAFENGLHPGEAGYLVAAASATSIVGRIVSGLAADRRKGHNIPFVSGQMVVGALGMMLISLGSPLPLIIGTFLGFAIGWSWPGLLMFAVVRVARDSPGVASSAVQTGAFAGGSLGPLLFGLVVSGHGYAAAWPAAMASLLIGAALLLVARRLFVADIGRRPPVRPFGRAPISPPER